jgi:chromosome segregation ATPase
MLTYIEPLLIGAVVGLLTVTGFKLHRKKKGLHNLAFDNWSNASTLRSTLENELADAHLTLAKLVSQLGPLDAVEIMKLIVPELATGDTLGLAYLTYTGSDGGSLAQKQRRSSVELKAMADQYRDYAYHLKSKIEQIRSVKADLEQTLHSINGIVRRVESLTELCTRVEKLLETRSSEGWSVTILENKLEDAQHSLTRIDRLLQQQELKSTLALLTECEERVNALESQALGLLVQQRDKQQSLDVADRDLEATADSIAQAKRALHLISKQYDVSTIDGLDDELSAAEQRVTALLATVDQLREMIGVPTDNWAHVDDRLAELKRCSDDTRALTVRIARRKSALEKQMAEVREQGKTLIARLRNFDQMMAKRSRDQSEPRTALNQILRATIVTVNIQASSRPNPKRIAERLTRLTKLAESVVDWSAEIHNGSGKDYVFRGLQLVASDLGIDLRSTVTSV